jgi:uncharacterized protein YdaU (DUF1376 family)
VAENPWFPYFPADYLADTSNLSVTEHGAYHLLMLEAYRQGGFVQCERSANALISHRLAHRVCRCESDADRDAVDVVLPRFFELRADRYYHRRVEKELVKRAEKSKKAARSASIRQEQIRSANAVRSDVRSQCYQQSQPQLESEGLGTTNKPLSDITHTQGTSVSKGTENWTHQNSENACAGGTNSGSGSMPPSAPPGRPDWIQEADLKPFLEAYCRAWGKPLRWETKYWDPAEKLLKVHEATPERVEAAARVYFAGLSGGIVPRFENFCREFGRYDALAQSPDPPATNGNGNGNGQRRDESKGDAMVRRNFEALATVLTSIDKRASQKPEDA